MIDQFSLYCGAALITLATISRTHAQSAPKETPLSMVNALHGAFGEHHARAVHTKGVMLEGTFEPATEARTLTRNPFLLAVRCPSWHASGILLAFPIFPITRMALRPPDSR